MFTANIKISFTLEPGKVSKPNSLCFTKISDGIFLAFFRFPCALGTLTVREDIKMLEIVSCCQYVRGPSGPVAQRT